MRQNNGPIAHDSLTLSIFTGRFSQLTIFFSKQRHSAMFRTNVRNLLLQMASRIRPVRMFSALKLRTWSTFSFSGYDAMCFSSTTSTQSGLPTPTEMMCIPDCRAILASRNVASLLSDIPSGREVRLILLGEN